MSISLPALITSSSVVVVGLMFNLSRLGKRTAIAMAIGIVVAIVLGLTGYFPQPSPP